MFPVERKWWHRFFWEVPIKDNQICVTKDKVGSKVPTLSVH